MLKKSVLSLLGKGRIISVAVQQIKPGSKPTKKNPPHFQPGGSLLSIMLMGGDKAGCFFSSNANLNHSSKPTLSVPCGFHALPLCTTDATNLGWTEFKS